MTRPARGLAIAIGCAVVAIGAAAAIAVDAARHAGHRSDAAVAAETRTPDNPVSTQVARAPSCPSTMPTLPDRNRSGSDLRLVPDTPVTALVCRYPSYSGHARGEPPSRQILIRGAVASDPVRLARALDGGDLVTGTVMCPLIPASTDIVTFSYPTGPPVVLAAETAGCALTTNGEIQAHTPTAATRLFSGLVGTDGPAAPGPPATTLLPRCPARPPQGTPYNDRPGIGRSLVPDRPLIARICRYSGADTKPGLHLIASTVVHAGIDLLADQLNGAPAAPGGPIACPLDDGKLTAVYFAYPSGAGVQVQVQDAGCGFATNGPTASWQVPDRPWVL